LHHFGSEVVNLTLSVTTNLKNDSTIINTTQTIADSTLQAINQLHTEAWAFQWMMLTTINHQCFFKLPQPLTHQPYTHQILTHPVDLVAMQHEIQSKMQELAQCFPAITNHNNTDPHLEVNKALQTTHGTLQTSKQHI